MYYGNKALIVAAFSTLYVFRAHIFGCLWFFFFCFSSAISIYHSQQSGLEFSTHEPKKRLHVSANRHKCGQRIYTYIWRWTCIYIQSVRSKKPQKILPICLFSLHLKMFGDAFHFVLYNDSLLFIRLLFLKKYFFTNLFVVFFFILFFVDNFLFFSMLLSFIIFICWFMNVSAVYKVENVTVDFIWKFHLVMFFNDIVGHGITITGNKS